MSQNNTLSAKAQNIVDNFINKNLSGSKISKTDVMKHVIVTLYSQSPNAKLELVKPFMNCIFHLHDYFTQEEIDVLVAEHSQVIKYCFDNSDRPYSVYDRYVLFPNDTMEDLICEDPLINPFKTPEYLIDLSMRLSGKRKAGEKVYLPYTEIADYALYNPEAEYHVEAISKYNTGEKTVSYENRYFSYSNLLLDSQGIKAEFESVDDDFIINTKYLSTHPDYVFAFNPMFSQESKNSFEYAESIWNTHQDVHPMDLANIIAGCTICTKSGGALDFVFPIEILDSKNFWKIMETMLRIKGMHCNATFINLGKIHYAANSVKCFFLHIEKDKGNDGMVRFFDASSTEFYEHNNLKVDYLMDMLDKEEYNAKYEQRINYTELTNIANPYSMEKKLPQLGLGAKYVPLGDLVEIVEGKMLSQEILSSIKIEEMLSNGYLRSTYGSISRDYLNCDIETKEITKDNFHYYIISKYVKSPCLIASIHTEEASLTNTPTGVISVGRLKDKHEYVFIGEDIIAFNLKSNIITEEYLLRSLTKSYCSKQISMLAEAEHISIQEAFRNNFLDIMIAVPSMKTQERRWKEDVERHLNKTHTSLKKAEEKIAESAEEFKRDVHMKKHAIGQTLFNLSNWWDLLQKARKDGNGIVDDSKEIGKIHKRTISDIYANIQMAMEKLQMQVDRFWRADGLQAQSMSLITFIKKYIQEHQSPMFVYDIAALSNNNVPNVTFSPEALTMVFDNIINNACSHGFENKALESNTVKFEVGISDDIPFITISNNGKPLHDKLTSEDVFTYARSSKTGQSHYGIGGYEVRNLMREFQGEAEFCSMPESDFPVGYKLTFKNINHVEH